MTETPTCWTITEDGGSHNRTICEGHDTNTTIDLTNWEFLFETEPAQPTA